MTKKILIICFGILISFNVRAQNGDCLTDFDYIVYRIKNDYPGYLDKVDEDNIKELKSLESEIREKMIQYPDSCYKYLNDYTAWFKDYHFPKVSNALGEIKMTVTQIDAGKQHNVVPAICHFVVDIL